MGNVTVEHVPPMATKDRHLVAHEVAESLLMQYSEWLDGNVDWENTALTHQQLVQHFLLQRNDDANPRVVYHP